MQFGAHYLPTYLSALDGPEPEFYRRMFEQMEVLDQVGFHQVWVTEHHFHEYGGTIPDPATFLSVVASRTTRIRLGVAIVVLPLHNPLEVAESYAMVDVISGGRLDLGVGRGTPIELEHVGIGYEDSVLRLREGTEIIRQGWSGEALDFTGKLFNYKGIRLLPKPVQRPHPPVWVAASRSDDTYRWAGEQGFHLLTLPYMYEPEVLRTSIDHYGRPWCRRATIPPPGRCWASSTSTSPAQNARRWRRQGPICTTTGGLRMPSTRGAARRDGPRPRSRSRGAT
jgi:alkanesulfonate monooxygenase SsuD/methylene tetrahydromethanopterin reductase-like flavin-dependent oxidoreductase (luciferase family)